MKTKQVFCLGGKCAMKKSVVLFCSSLTVLLSCAFSQAATIQGTVVNEKNMPVEGVMVSAIDTEQQKWIGFTRADLSSLWQQPRKCKCSRPQKPSYHSGWWEAQAWPVYSAQQKRQCSSMQPVCIPSSINGH